MGKVLYYLVVICFAFISFACTEELVVKEKTEKIFTIDTTANLSKEQKEKVYRLDTLFLNLSKSNAFNGNILIAENGKIIYKKCIGVSNQKENKLLNDSSLFQLASVSKTITATLTLKLVAEKKLNLEDNVTIHLPDFPYSGIKIKHLLSHRSGLGNYIYFTGDFVSDKTAKLTNEEIYKLITSNKPPIYFEPDRQFNYNNTNYMLLALICERVAKSNFKTLCKEKIFNTCGMKNTFFADEITSNKNKTQGYTFSMREVEGDMFDYVWGDKGIYTTTYDLLLFEEAYFNNKIIDSSLIQLATTPMSSERKLGNYGYGWRMKEFNTDNKLIYHNGWWHGYRTALQRRLKDKTCIILLSNRLNSSVYQTWRIFKAIDADTSRKTEKEEE
jgi:CubicO group peptidase (beta-lactamase class C family)